MIVNMRGIAKWGFTDHHHGISQQTRDINMGFPSYMIVPRWSPSTYDHHHGIFQHTRDIAVVLPSSWSALGNLRAHMIIVRAQGVSQHSLGLLAHMIIAVGLLTHMDIAVGLLSYMLVAR